MRELAPAAMHAAATGVGLRAERGGQGAGSREQGSGRAWQAGAGAGQGVAGREQGGAGPGQRRAKQEQGTGECRGVQGWRLCPKLPDEMP